MTPQQKWERRLKWLHCWLVCVPLAGSLGAWILATVLTQRPLFVSMSATILATQ